MSNAEPVRIKVDPSNPGQFFACCGLLELADRVWGGAEGKFSSDEAEFLISPLTTRGSDAIQIVKQLVMTGLDGELSFQLRIELNELEAKKRLLKKDKKELSTEEETRRKELGRMQREGYIVVGYPFNLRLEWWTGDTEDTVKTWAGSQEVLRIARAALDYLPAAFQSGSPFEYSCVMMTAQTDVDLEERKALPPQRSRHAKSQNDGRATTKVEPFYFDARRGLNALAIDIGFMPDSLAMTTLAYPAVEFLCLVGLQRFRPLPTDRRRVFDYFTWTVPLAVQIAPIAAVGRLPAVHERRYRFEVAFRTDQRKHKTFTPAIFI